MTYRKNKEIEREEERKSTSEWTSVYVQLEFCGFIKLPHAVINKYNYIYIYIYIYIYVCIRAK